MWTDAWRNKLLGYLLSIQSSITVVKVRVNFDYRANHIYYAIMHFSSRNINELCYTVVFLFHTNQLNIFFLTFVIAFKSKIFVQFCESC